MPNLGKARHRDDELADAKFKIAEMKDQLEQQQADQFRAERLLNKRIVLLTDQRDEALDRLEAWKGGRDA